jgi:hypothetical protein
MGAKHRCNKSSNGVTWNLCIVCEGRIHNAGCTTKRDKSKDCCEARHKMLHDAGQTIGITDLSFKMYDPGKPSWSKT